MKIKTNTIDDLNEYAQMWSIGELKHLYIQGTPGSGKTHTFKEVTEDVTRSAWVGNCSPFAFYKKLYTYRDADLIVLDDIDGLLYDRNGLRLLKEVMGSDEENEVHWSSNRTGAGKEVPSSFKVSAGVCVITNDFGSRNQHTQAVQSRAVVLEHAPEFEQTVNYACDCGIITKQMKEKLLDTYPAPLYVNLRDLKVYDTLRKQKKDWYALFKENLNDD